MTKISRLALNRKFEKDEDGAIRRRDNALAANAPEKIGECVFCKKPVLASPGQILRKNMHKACKRARRAQGYRV